jgi:membrane protein
VCLSADRTLRTPAESPEWGNRARGRENRRVNRGQLDMAESVLDTKQQVESIWNLGGLRPRELAKRVWTEMNHDDVWTMASALAYNFLLAIFPMLLFLVALFGVFASQRAELQNSLFYYFSQVLPPSAFQLVSKTLDEIIKNSGGGKLTLGLVLALWSGAGGMTSLISGLNAAYHVRDSRSFIKVRAIALGLTLAVSVLVVAALFIVLAGGNVAEIVGAKLNLTHVAVVAWKVVQWPIALGFLILAFALIYYFGPDLKEQHWYWITPGSLIGVALWLAVSFAFRVYLHFFNSYSKSYGSLGAVIILLLWFYVTGLAFLVGAEVNAEIEHAAAERGHPEAKLEGQKAA